MLNPDSFHRYIKIALAPFREKERQMKEKKDVIRVQFRHRYARIGGRRIKARE